MSLGVEALTGPHVWRGRSGCVTRPVRTTGFDALDEALGGGWPWGAIIEIHVERYGSGELGLLCPVLASLRERLLAFVAPPFVPYPLALTHRGIDVGRVLVVRPAACTRRAADADEEALWAAEQAVRSGACAAVLAWLPSPDGIALRRLQLAAEEQRCGLVLFCRSHRALRRRSPAALRLAVTAEEAKTRVEILKCRGGRPGSVLVDSRQTPPARSDG